jgi:hypothetical protein
MMTAVPATVRTEREQLRLYAEVVTSWSRGFDTWWISQHLQIPEHVVARWVANFRDAARAE